MIEAPTCEGHKPETSREEERDCQQHTTNQINETGPGSFVIVELSQEQKTEQHMVTSGDLVVVTLDDVSSKTYFFSFSRGT